MNEIQLISLGIASLTLLLGIVAGFFWGKKSRVSIETRIVENRDQSQLIRVISHDFRNILSVLRMVISGPELESETSATAERAIVDMEDMLDRCFHLDQLERKELELQIQTVHLRSLIGEILEPRPYAHRIHLHVAKSTPEIRTSNFVIRLIMFNLIDNAARYAKKESPISIEVTPENHHAEANPDHSGGILISIENTIGPAGPPDPEQIFRKFYRSQRAKSQMGLGLGLYISQGFAHLVGARIQFALIEDRVRFELWIPH